MAARANESCRCYSVAKQLNRVCVVGLGYVGLPTAAALATNDIEVIGVDIDPVRIATVNSGAAPIAEPQLDAMVRGAIATGKLRAQRQFPTADAFIIAVPTPFTRNLEPDLCHLRDAVHHLAPVLQVGNLIVLESTSPVGTTEEMCNWLAEARPDLSFPNTNGEASDIRVAYSPERVLPGRILVELLNNDRVVGGVTPKCAAAATNLYATFSHGTCCTTTARTAELAKLTENAYRDVNIAFANEISLVCTALEVNPWELIELTNRHPRVDVLKPGPGVGGHCIAVDPWFIVHSAPHLTPLIRTARKVNDDQPLRVVDQVLASCTGISHPNVACFGLAYKADVGDLRESPSITVARHLRDRISGNLVVVEPYIDHLPPELVNVGEIELVELNDALESSNVIVLLTDHRVFRDIDFKHLAGKILVDTRGIWNRE